MPVRAKFYCESIKEVKFSPESDFAKEVFLKPFYDGKDNMEWSKSTPSGELKMYITNSAAAEQFEAGKFYYLDITPVE